jgi:hypothetical protein
VIDHIAAAGAGRIGIEIDAIGAGDAGDLRLAAGEADAAVKRRSTSGVSRLGSTVMKIGCTRAARAASPASNWRRPAPIVCMSVGQTSGQKV